MQVKVSEGKGREGEEGEGRISPISVTLSPGGDDGKLNVKSRIF